MAARLKPIGEQVVVITGASSGIGLETARQAAAQGARVVMAARNGAALAKAAADIEAQGGKALAVPTDVTRRAEIQALADAAVTAFGGFDTWVNNAGLGIFGRLDQVSDADNRRLFDVNFWGLVAGTQIAYAHLKAKGGAIINLGSVVSDVAIPVQGMYAASKHAIKGFTDAFRMEVGEAGTPVSVTLIKPASIDTPFPAHARNYLDREPTLPPPLYAPADVAQAIVHAAAHGGRDYIIGGGGKLMSALNKRLPAAVDWMGARMGDAQSAGPVVRPREGSLDRPGPDGAVHGNPRHAVHRSLYTGAQTNPLAAVAVLAAGFAGLSLLARATRR